jgi:tRNA G18 (ribose-2'-O)-methylase SpoU
VRAGAAAGADVDVEAAGRGPEPLLEVGVGPWPGGPAAWPDLDVDGVRRYDPELLEHGDRRNVVDRYRYWTLEAVVADLDTRRHPFHVAVENWAHDLNIGSVVRTANAFAAAEVHIVGRRRWNRRGAMVTDRYQHVRHHPQVGDLVTWAGAAGLPVLGIDNLPGSVALEGHALPRACVLLFGQESVGLSDEARAACEHVLHIRQFGSTRSINAAAAAAIAMHTWVAQHA